MTAPEVTDFFVLKRMRQIATMDKKETPCGSRRLTKIKKTGASASGA